jgi:HEAT repeat protein
LQSLGSWTEPLQVWFDGPPDLKKTLYDNPAAVAVVIDLLRNSDPDVRASAAVWFPESRPELPLAFPVLADVIRNHPSASTRSHAAYRLAVLYTRLPGTFGPEAKRLVVAVLTEALRDPDTDVQRESGYALRKVDPEAATQAGVPEDVTSKLLKVPQPQAMKHGPRTPVLD